MLQAKLIVVGGEVKTKEVNLKLPVVIGRGRDATLTLPHALVSRAHCEIFERAGRLVIRDLGSLNGTYVNNYRIRTEQPVLPGELITIGTVTFRADYVLDSEAVSAGDAMEADSGAASVPIQDVSSPVIAGRFDTTVAGRGPVKSLPPSRLTPVIAAESPAAPTPAGGIEFLQPPAEKPSDISVPARDNLNPPATISAELPASADSSDIFSGFDFGDSPQKSISTSALENLPGQATPAVSFVGQIGGAHSPEFIEIDQPIQVDSQSANSAQPVDENDLQLGSFIRKLPR